MRCTTAQGDQRRETCATILVIEDERFVRDRGAHDRACHRQSERGLATADGWARLMNESVNVRCLSYIYIGISGTCFSN